MLRRPRPPTSPRTLYAAWAAGLVALVVTVNFLVATGNRAECWQGDGSVFQGEAWRTNETVSVKPVFETTWFRVERHSIRTQSGDVIDDWVWIDEKDMVNVIVENADGTFRLFRQTKYGLSGNSLAPVGGYVEPGETPLQAAQRELNEEMALESKEWIALGSYRVSVNRGFGMVSSFLARSATPVKNKKPSDDLEKQVLVTLTRSQLKDAVIAGKFKEVKWAATASLALVHTS